MESHLLRTFVTVAALGSFSAAARQLGYTQSAVSQHIAALEGDLGVALLHRRPVEPTAAGQRLLDHAGPILRRMEAARADIRRAAGEPPGKVVLGGCPLALAGWAARALAEARRSLPGLEVSVRAAARDAVVDGVALGEIDLGLVDGIVAPSDPLRLHDADFLTTAPVAEEPVALALPDEHPLATRSSVRLRDLADASWLDAPGIAAPLGELRAAVGTDHLRSALRYEGGDTRTLLSLVAEGHGLLLLPASALAGAPGVRAVPLSAPRLVHRTELVHGRAPGAAVSALAAALPR
ncbi:LysR family transcriptional regulator [Amycolatopsis cynarae]